MDKVSLLETIAKLLASFFGKDQTQVVPTPAPKAPAPAPAPAPMVLAVPIDWSNLECPINGRFKVKEALWLNSWGAAHRPTEEQKQAIVGIANGAARAADILEKALGKHVSIIVHAWMRPEHANIPGSIWHDHDYNRYIYETQVWKGLSDAEKAAKHVPLSPHRTGHAIDFHIVGFEGEQGCAKIREMLKPHLAEIGLRMENIVGPWVHLDDMPVAPGHDPFFKPY